MNDDLSYSRDFVRSLNSECERLRGLVKQNAGREAEDLLTIDSLRYALTVAESNRDELREALREAVALARLDYLSAEEHDELDRLDRLAETVITACVYDGETTALEALRKAAADELSDLSHDRNTISGG